MEGTQGRGKGKVIPDLEGCLVGRQCHEKAEGIVGMAEPPCPRVDGRTVVVPVDLALVGQPGRTGQAEGVVEMPHGRIEMGLVSPVPPVDDPRLGGESRLGGDKPRGEQGRAGNSDTTERLRKSLRREGAHGEFFLASRLGQEQLHRLQIDLAVGMLAPAVGGRDRREQQKSRENCGPFFQNTIMHRHRSIPPFRAVRNRRASICRPP